MLLPSPQVHLAYCTNIHAAHSWAQTWAQLRAHLPAVKRKACPDAAMGVGLRLSAEAAAQLRSEHVDEFRTWLNDQDLYLLTINGFVHGTFHDASVKQTVYQPDWSTADRLAYTLDLIEIAAAVAPESLQPSISTVPVSFGDPKQSRHNEAVQTRLLECAAHLWRCEEETGRTIRLALEPEPMCQLETIAQTVSFFEANLLSAAAIEQLARQTGLSSPQAEAALRRHLGVCVDTCHAAVEFEDPRDCIDALLDAGIEIPKVQVTTGLELDPRQPTALEALVPYAEDVYLHQVVIDHGDRLERVLDLPEALATARRLPPEDRGRRWRVHFHVPVHFAAVPPFHNTQSFLRPCLEHIRSIQATQHLEVETYTWDVLPPEARQADVDDAIAAEMLWVAKQWQG